MSSDLSHLTKYSSKQTKTDIKMPLIPEDACLPEDGRGIFVDFC